MPLYIWKNPTSIDKEVLEEFPELHPIVVQLLYNRGLKTQKEIDEFLYPEYSQDVHNPYLFRDMDKACRRIYQAIEKKEKITVYGDYDADGVCAAVILKTVLEKLGAEVEVYLPHREKQGYGLNLKAIEEIAAAGTKLIITCDCGISNVEEVALANKNKVDVIISDHHSEPEKLPDALAIIHPRLEGEKYPFKFLAGGGVAFKLAQGLIQKSKQLNEREKEIEEKWLLDLVAISTVADMMPLLGENRTLLKYGLLVLRKTKRPGLLQLIKVANLTPEKINAQNIGFSLGPRINAAGRMDHANLAYYTLIEKDEDKAAILAGNINQSNIDRQKMTEQMVKEAKEMKLNQSEKLLAFYKADWPVGLTGLVAGRLLKDFGKPAIVMTKVGEQIIGSARSIEGFDISALLSVNQSLLNRFGGHPQAAGFALSEKNKDQFVANLKEAAENIKDSDLQKKLEIELEIDFLDISWELMDMLEKFEPYGHQNPESVFMSRNIFIQSARRVGLDQKHWKLELAKDGCSRGAIAFFMGDIDLAVGQEVDVVYNLSINQYNGSREIQMVVKDIKSAEKNI
ncbi:MAG: single-stranded-DNA-specific exonuclease RecJ [Patescibacteria group bacterium]|nr:single-stranded-DNA-specific exonuclease RecJ [Patescibacteria group bacterium]